MSSKKSEAIGSSSFANIKKKSGKSVKSLIRELILCSAKLEASKKSLMRSEQALMDCLSHILLRQESDCHSTTWTTASSLAFPTATLSTSSAKVGYLGPERRTEPRIYTCLPITALTKSSIKPCRGKRITRKSTGG